MTLSAGMYIAARGETALPGLMQLTPCLRGRHVIAAMVPFQDPSSHLVPLDATPGEEEKQNTHHTAQHHHTSPSKAQAQNPRRHFGNGSENTLSSTLIGGRHMFLTAKSLCPDLEVARTPDPKHHAHQRNRCVIIRGRRAHVERPGLHRSGVRYAHPWAGESWRVRGER